LKDIYPANRFEMEDPNSFETFETTEMAYEKG